MTDWHVITRDEEGDVASLIGPFSSMEEAQQFVDYAMGELDDDDTNFYEELLLCEITIRRPWAPHEWLADKRDVLESFAEFVGSPEVKS